MTFYTDESIRLRTFLRRVEVQLAIADAAIERSGVILFRSHEEMVRSHARLGRDARIAARPTPTA